MSMMGMNFGAAQRGGRAARSIQASVLATVAVAFGLTLAVGPGAHAAHAARVAPADTADTTQQDAAITTPGETRQIGKAIPELPKDLVVRVGVCDLPPWSTPPSGNDPAWSGLAVQLWKRIAQNLQVKYEVKSYSYSKLEQALGQGEVDIAATGIAIDAENLMEFTLTPAFDQSGISIATRERQPLTILGVLARLWEPEILGWFVIIFALVFVFGAILWATERKRNPPFEGSAARGILEAAWLSIVTLTTVGYGDRVPVTLAGKLLAALWMTIGFVLLTVLSGVVTSVLTVQRLQPLVAGPGDLLHARVAVVEGSTAQSYLDNAGVAVRVFDTLEAAVTALEDRRIDAVVGSTAGLTYMAERSNDRDVVVLPRPLERSYVGMGMRFGLDPALEKRIELELVRVVHAPDYRTYRDAVMGEAGNGADLPMRPRSPK